MSDTSQLRSALVTGASVIALTAFAAPALAQTAGQPGAGAVAAPADQGANANVVVIAQHTTTKLQKIPVAVSVFTGASRDRIGISSVQEVTNFAPGFVYDPTTVHAYLRGVGRQSINVTDDQRVATYEDEFYVYSPYGLDKSSLFLSQEQIERGPQNVGGRNAAAGSIDMISVRPADHPYAEVRATIGNYDHYEIEGAASDEIAPGLDARIAGYWNDQEQGYLKNLAGGPSESGHIKEWYIEGQFDWKINDHADLWARSFFSGWDNFGDAGARNGYVTGSYDEVNLSDSDIYPGASLFVNPNFGYAAILPGARAGAIAAGGPTDVEIPISVALKTPGIFNNPSMTDYQNFAAVGPRHLTLRGYDDANYIFTYHFPNVDFKYVGGWQGYNYDLNYPDGDTDVLSYTLPGSAFGIQNAFTGAAAASVAAAKHLPASAIPGIQAALLAGLPAPSALVINPTLNLHYTEDDAWWSQEVSFQSTDSGPFQWIAGGLFYHQHYQNPITTTSLGQANTGNPDSLTSFLLAGENPFAPGALTPAAANPNHYAFLEAYQFSVETESAYGQLSYKVNDDIKLTGNLRFTNDSKYGEEEARFVAFNESFINGLAPFFGAATPSFDETIAATCPTGNGIQSLIGVGSCDAGPLAKGVRTIGTINPLTGIESRSLAGSSNAVTGGAGIEWTPTPDIFMYARYGRGYESLSFNAGSLSSSPEVAPEYLNSYEVGYKQTFGRQLSIDVAAFYYDYDGFQQPISVSVNGILEGAFVNVPKAESTGIEFEGVWSPVRDLVITGTYSYDYTAILTGCSAAAAAQTSATGVTPGNNLCVVDTQDPDAVAPGAHPVLAGLQSVKGNPLVNAPRNKVAFDVAYTWHLDPGNLTFSGAYVWRDTQEGAIFNRFYNTAPSWSDVDLRAIWSGNHDRYEVIGFVKNVFNTIQYDTGSGGAGFTGNNVMAFSPTKALNWVNVYNIAPPRTFGVELRYKFF